MKKFRKKPIVVEVEQWFSYKGTEVKGVDSIIGIDAKSYFVRDMNNHVTFIEEGDFIIKDQHGYSVCKSNCFPSYYEETSFLEESLYLFTMFAGGAILGTGLGWLFGNVHPGFALGSLFGILVAYVRRQYRV